MFLEEYTHSYNSTVRKTARNLGLLLKIKELNTLQNAERTWIYFRLVPRNFFNDGKEVKDFRINTPINNFKSSIIQRE